MQIVRIEDLQVRHIAAKNTSRAGGMRIYQYLEGRPGELDNFMFQVYHTDSDYETPRHRHNFDQIRVQVEGDEYDYSRNGKMRLGDVGYFPEGTYYGPAKSGDGVATLLLQIGGMSGQGYMSQSEYVPAVAELKKKGEFKDGIFTWHDQNGQKHNQDGYEAVWEFCRKQRLEYPPERFQAPVFMNPESFDWFPYEGTPGVDHKILGRFGGGGGMKLGYFRMNAGATIKSAPERTLFFVLSGSGRANDQQWVARSAIHVDRGDSCTLTADQPATLFYIGIPDHSLISTAKREVSAKRAPKFVPELTAAE